VSDRTDWRRLVTGAPREIDLPGLARQLRARIDAPAEIEWRESFEIFTVEYPVSSYCPPERLNLDHEQREICDNLGGIKGQYLILDTGVINIRKYGGYKLEVDLL